MSGARMENLAMEDLAMPEEEKPPMRGAA